MGRDDWIEQQHLLASIDRQIAELFVKRAQILDELADGKADPRTGRRKQRPPQPSFNPVSSTDQARADAALRQLEKRRRERA